MDFKNDKLCYRLLSIKEQSKFTTSDKRHYNLLEKKNIEIQGDLDSIDEILHSNGYLDRKLSFWLVNPEDRKKDVVKFSDTASLKIDKGIAFYKEHSEVKKIRLEKRLRRLYNTIKIIGAIGVLIGIYKFIETSNTKEPHSVQSKPQASINHSRTDSSINRSAMPSE